MGDTPEVADHLDLTRTDGLPVCRARVASSFLARFRGLLGAAGLPAGEGMLFPGTSSVHTHFMRVAIDVVFLDHDGCVISIRHALRPWRMAAAKAARAVLELAAGECERLGLAEGDVLEATRPEPGSRPGRGRTRSAAPRSGS